jgi:glucose/arabinose dehydrogenase
LLFYSGSEFPQWRGNAFIGGLSSTALIRIELGAGGAAREAQRLRMPARVRAVEQGPDGALWLLEDGRGARLVKLTARR